MKISKIYTYPIKGIRATELDSAVVTKHGFPYDRRYMLLQVQEDGSYKNMAIGHFSAMALYQPAINHPADGDALSGTITITYRPPHGEERTFDIPLAPKTEGLEEIEVTMHKSPTKAYKMEQKYNDHFSSCFGFDCVLVYLGSHLRRVLMSTSGNKQSSNNGWLSSMTSRATELVMGGGEEEKKITFADCAPYLVVSDKSMDDVHHRLKDDQPYDILKFRPNIIVSGAEQPWEEDFWGELTIGADTKVVCEHNCGRCKSLNVDYETGKVGTGEAGSMLKKLSSDRRVDEGCKWSPVFGRYSFLHASSDGHTIRVGDDVTVSKRNSEKTAFDWEGLTTLKSK
ncbi:hypothetical protein LTR62_002394 [Meristemomyces frigidus]|uniref:MOSC domain-containing protein n=1 Tax=Meristemomyces frigidus TaxID=1508187 RepID=A0AAN7YL81_9PEZI|nr:hypothetical protein LTR62_002394 [Meristemomyces frigidus]